jgi:hypothetical protein
VAILRRPARQRLATFVAARSPDSRPESHPSRRLARRGLSRVGCALRRPTGPTDSASRTLKTDANRVERIRAAVEFTQALDEQAGTADRSTKLNSALQGTEMPRFGPASAPLSKFGTGGLWGGNGGGTQMRGERLLPPCRTRLPLNATLRVAHHASALRNPSSASALYRHHREPTCIRRTLTPLPHGRRHGATSPGSSPQPVQRIRCRPHRRRRGLAWELPSGGKYGILAHASREGYI